MTAAVGSTIWVLMFAALPAVTSNNPAGQDEAAQQAFRAGVEAARQERWVDARVQFEKAHSLSPRPVVLINLAGAQARTGRLTEAARNYHRILDDVSSPETASFRRAAAEVLPPLEARIPRVRLRPSGLAPTDVIRIDGETVDAGALDAGQSLDPGDHTLVVQHDGVERARVLFALAERELRYITLPLPAIAASSTAASGGVAVLDRPDFPTAPAEPSRTRSWWASPWTWTAVAALVAAASITTVVVMGRGDETYSGNIPPGRISVR